MCYFHLLLCALLLHITGVLSSPPPRTDDLTNQIQAVQRIGKIEKKDVCQLPKVVGKCGSTIPRFYFNKQLRKCTSFTFSGCGENSNNFINLMECEYKCGGDNVVRFSAGEKKSYDFLFTRVKTYGGFFRLEKMAEDLLNGEEIGFKNTYMPAFRKTHPLPQYDIADLHTATLTGAKLTISHLTPYNEGVYRCRLVQIDGTVVDKFARFISDGCMSYMGGALERRIDDLENIMSGKIAQLETLVGGQSSDMAVKLTDMSSLMSKNAKTLANLEQLVSDFTNQIQAVSQRIGKIEKRDLTNQIQAVSQRIGRIEKKDLTNQIQAVSQRIGRIEKKGVYQCVGGDVSCSICQSGGGEDRTVNFGDGVRFIAPPTVVLGVRWVYGVDHRTYVTSTSRTSFGMFMYTRSSSYFQVTYTACGYA